MPRLLEKSRSRAKDWRCSCFCSSTGALPFGGGSQKKWNGKNRIFQAGTIASIRDRCPFPRSRFFDTGLPAWVSRGGVPPATASDPDSFAPKQSDFPVAAARETSDAGVRSKNPVARYQHGHRVCAASLSNSPDCAGFAYGAGYLGVTHRFARTNLLKHLPNGPLKFSRGR
jgi:hypothetical protein